MKIRNQIIRKRYAKKAKELAQKSQSVTDVNEKTKCHRATLSLHKHIHQMERTAELKNKRRNYYLEY